MPIRVKNRSNRQRGATRISSKHQVTIPVDALAGAGLSVGDIVWAEVEAPGVIRLVSADSVLSRLAGAHSDAFSSGPMVDELRDEWDR